MNIDKNLMKEFLSNNSKKEIKHVINVARKATDDEIGVADEHYIVKVETKNGIETCYVYCKSFDNYINNKTDVIWKESSKKQKDSKFKVSTQSNSDEYNKIVSHWKNVKKELEKELAIVKSVINIINNNK